MGTPKLINESLYFPALLCIVVQFLIKKMGEPVYRGNRGYRILLRMTLKN